jgi:TctA family transporter
MINIIAIKTKNIMEAIILWVVFGIAGGMIYQSKNRPFVRGFLWGLIFGVIGIIVTLVKKPLEEERE